MTTLLQDAQPQTLGQRIRTQRKRLGLSVTELARRAGVTRDTLSEWERDGTAPRSNRLLTLAGVMETNIGWLLEGHGECSPQTDPDGEIAALREQLGQARELVHQLSTNLDALQTRVNALESRRSSGS
ncbi:helix-turn-helix domain-containing protein [Rhodovibrio salinarum]|uniref:Transcriptional regulator n=1 Tax=Rhodovibrio salinarum TaxID=1087 RepID=A0A934QLJ6_9PROT|nr:helix-turn-helix domain-containing protein [Rhodovibrio salinarum]MBK1698745.1 transcriptional regulator [Rhodovibrio salinarum]